MARIKGWKKVKDGKNNIVYQTTKTIGVNKFPLNTIQIFGEENRWNLHSFKSVPAPRKGWYMNEFIVKNDNITGKQYKSKDLALHEARFLMNKYNHMREKEIEELYDYYNNNSLSDAEEIRVLNKLENLGFDIRLL